VHGVTGFIVTDVDTATAAVQRISELDRLTARKHVEDHFSAERMTDRYLRVYQEVRQRCYEP
jgi:glycosyltransferase involved in cell wall biosynthesis